MQSHPNAVSNLYSSYDEEIPAAALAAARAIDAEFEAANPEYFAAIERAKRNVRMARAEMAGEIYLLRQHSKQIWFDEAQRGFRHQHIRKIMASFRRWNAVAAGRAEAA